MVFTFIEIFDMILMTVIVGFIISGFIKLKHTYTPKIFDWDDIKFSIYVTAPAIILHELGHKFTAIAFGFSATFHSPISIKHILNPLLVFGDFPALLMIIAVVARIYGARFLFFIPAFVSIMGNPSNLQYSAIAFAGPAINLILWLGSAYYIKQNPHMDRKKFALIYLTKQINMLLFIFNMLPIPGFDGSKVFAGLFGAFG